ncbi:MAG: hypothetical protein ABIB11_01895 [Candidatus Omnitrophota bacterium]
MRYRLFVLFLWFCWSINSSVMAEELLNNNIKWQRYDSSINSDVITAVEVNNEKGVVFAAGSGNLYKSLDYGQSWECDTFFKKTKGIMNFIKTDKRDLEKIFVGTSYGLYLSQDLGLHWKRILNSKESSRKEMLSIAISPRNKNIVLVSTKGGIFLSKDGGRDWSFLRTFVDEKVDTVVITKKGYYAAIDKGVYYAKKADGLWERIYSYNRFVDDENGYDNDDEDVVYEDAQANLYADENSVNLSYNGGIAVYDEKEKNWQDFNTEGLLTEDINDIVIYKDRFYLATAKGIYYYDKQSSRWIYSSSGIAVSLIFKLVVSEKKGFLFAATEGGLYRADLWDIEENADFEKMDFSMNEPGIKEVQTAAMRYAEVSPEKIMWMRNAARKSAWFPELSVGLDRDVARTIDLDRGGTGDPDFYIEGPRDKDWGWDLNLSWDLSKVIWNDDQTSIDVRSRLMVQLRNDILDEITKLYFERRRLQLELSQQSFKQGEAFIFKQLRYEELTANIDALTGGYFSEQIAVLKEE